MRHYEVVFLVNPGQSEQMPALVDRYEGIIKNNGGSVHRSEDWGRRQLAYPIQNFHKAHYWLLNIESAQPAVDELKEAFRFNDHVIRSMVMRREDAVTDESLLAQEKQKEDERKAKAAALNAEADAANAAKAKVEAEEKAAAEAKKPEVKKEEE